jgi:hypothetical protein
MKYLWISYKVSKKDHFFLEIVLNLLEGEVSLPSFKYAFFTVAAFSQLV